MFKFKFYASFNGFYIWIDGDSNAQFTLKRDAVTTIDEKMTKNLMIKSRNLVCMKLMCEELKARNLL